ncbi:MAG: transglycosylase SLT domain-containing protein [Lysobacterales bacterium]
MTHRATPSLRLLSHTAAAALLLAASATAVAGGGIRRYTDAKGVVHFTNVSGDNRGTGKPVPQLNAKTQRAIYKFKDAVGVTHYTDQSPGRGRAYTIVAVFCPACDPKSTVNWTRTRLNLTAYLGEIDAAALANGVDAALVRALIHAESAFNPRALSHKGAQGLMQLMPATAAQYGVTDSFDAAQNIAAGVKHLAMLIKLYNGDVRLVAAAYNAGEGAVRKYGGVPPYAETRVYVERVGTLHQRYRTGA